MEPKLLRINRIPAALWGAPSKRLIVAVHGAQSSKMDNPFRILAEALPHCQVLSFDMPEHGDRKNESILCKPPVCIEELSDVLDYAESGWTEICLFAVSLGAYFSLLACQGRTISHAWFLSPVVDMERLTRDMMGWFKISKARLEAEGTIPTPMGQASIGTITAMSAVTLAAAGPFILISFGELRIIWWRRKQSPLSQSAFPAVCGL